MEGRKTAGSDVLPSLIDRALGALATDRVAVGLTVQHLDGHLVVDVGLQQFRFGDDRIHRALAWERLVDALPRTLERARLDEMHQAAAETWPAAWSVCTTAMVAAWLDHNPAGADRSAWRETITNAADTDGDVKLEAEDGSSLDGYIRSRRLSATIRLSGRVAYDSVEHLVTAQDQIPHTVAIAAGGANLADLVDIPWVRKAGIFAEQPTVGPKGTAIRLREALVPLAPIPGAALRSARAGAPSHLPWIVTIAEQEALNAIDAVAHETL